MENLQPNIYKRYKCELCEYRSNRTTDVVRHNNFKHGHANVNRTTLPQANRVVSQPTVGYGGSNSESVHPMPYAESLDTEYESECS